MRVSVQAALGDATAPRLASEAIARLFGAAASPAAAPVYGVPEVPRGPSPASSEASAGSNHSAQSFGWSAQALLTEWVYERESSTETEANVPQVSNGVHECLRRDHESQVRVLTVQFRSFVLCCM